MSTNPPHAHAAGTLRFQHRSASGVRHGKGAAADILVSRVRRRESRARVAVVGEGGNLPRRGGVDATRRSEMDGKNGGAVE